MSNETKKNWALFNPHNKIFVEALTWAQFKQVSRMVPQTDIKAWFYWHEGLENWVPLKDLESGPKKIDKQSLPPLPPQMGTHISTNPLKAQEQNRNEKRTTKRFQVKEKVTLHVGTTTYDLHTEDLSIGGAKLNKSLPNISVPFRVVLDPHEKAIELEALFLDNSGGANARIQFLPTEGLDQLRDYLLGI